MPRLPYRGDEPKAYVAGGKFAGDGQAMVAAGRLQDPFTPQEARARALTLYPGPTLKASRLRKAFLDGFLWASAPTT